MTDDPAAAATALPTPEQVEEAISFARDAVEFAYQNGLHEIGWNPVDRIVAHIAHLSGEAKATTEQVRVLTEARDAICALFPGKSLERPGDVNYLAALVKADKELSAENEAELRSDITALTSRATSAEAALARVTEALRYVMSAHGEQLHDAFDQAERILSEIAALPPKPEAL
jgi:hypothetical protein